MIGRLLLSFFGCVCVCAAQEDLLIRPIGETDVPRLLAVLKAEGAGLHRLDTEGAAAPRFKYQDVDPLEWLKRNSTYVAVPPGAVYEPECSRFASAQNAGFVAVFSYRVKASEYAGALVNGDERAALELSLPSASTAARRKTDSIANSAREFYRRRKFHGSDAARRLLVFRYLSPDNSVWVEFYQANAFLPDGCRSMATGPMLMLTAGVPSSMAPVNESAPAPPFDFAAALRKAGMRESEYQGLRIALLMARSDAQDPSVLQQLADPDASPAVKRQIAIRQQNAEMYRKHADEFGPVLDSLLAIN